MKRSWVRLLVALVVAVAGFGWCRMRDRGRVDASALQQDATGPRLRIAIIGDSSDSRIPPVREAIAHWNREFIRLGRRIHFDSVVVRADSIPDELLRGAGGEVYLGAGPATSRLNARLSNVPADVVIALSHTDLISFGTRWRAGSRGVVGIRRSDIPPLSLPNTVRNVIAHEIGHVLGLDHNADSTTLMCGRPADCRPAAFVSDSSRFFPLTVADDQRLQKRWP